MAIAERKYSGMEAISRVFKVLAWVAAIGGSLAVIGRSFTFAADERSAEALVNLILGGLLVALYVLFLLAVSEGIKIVIDIEDNTRRTANALLGAPPSSPPSSYPPPPGG